MQELARATPRMRTAYLPFAEIPHQSKLFLDYLADPLSLKEYYPNAVASPLDVKAYANAVLNGYVVDRQAVCEALSEINTAAGSSDAAHASIQRLRDRDCIAVLTGQQAGLFSGPLYTIYKALSAVRMAEQLSSKGVKAVPMFWAATDDHDLEEVAKTFGIGGTGELFSVRSQIEDTGRQVGDINLDGSIADAITEFFERSAATEFSDDLREQLLANWSSGQRWGDAFLKTMAMLFKDCGLILVDPMHQSLKGLASPIYRAAIERSSGIRDALRARDRVLTANGFHSQVLVEDDYFPLFWIDDEGKRLSLRASDDVIRAKGSKTEFSPSDMLAVAAETPERLSPGVMLRPVVQDYLFPTICYFGGGAEVAYFAQNAEVYRVLDRHATTIFHRQSFTIVEPKQRRILDRHVLSLKSLFDGHEATALRLAENEDLAESADAFVNAEQSIDAELDRLDKLLSAIDETVAKNLATRRRKIIYHIGTLKNKALRALSRKNGDRARQLDTLFASLLPEKHLQERAINIFTYVNKYGPNFIDWVYNSTDVEQKDHVILDI